MNKEILVIDDNPDIRFLICNILKENAEEKMQTSSQEDIEPEESIYSKFATDKDKFLNYRAHHSSVLLGNVMKGRKSNKYYKYTQYYLQSSSLY